MTLWHHHHSTPGTKMRTLLKIATAAVAIALLAPAPFAQAKGKRQQQQPAANAEDVAKKKALDADYKKALSSVPDVTEKQDPWKTMR
jgi:hypothetical protein